MFHQLSRDQIAGIVRIQINALEHRLENRGLGISLTESAVEAIASEGFDPQFGARPLKRTIQQRIENPIATRILAGEYDAGDQIMVDYEQENFTFGRSS